MTVVTESYFNSRPEALAAAAARGWQRTFPGVLSPHGTYFEDEDGRIMSLRFAPSRETRPFYFAPATVPS